MAWKIRQIDPPRWGPEEPCSCGVPICAGKMRSRVRADGTPPEVGDAWYEPEEIPGTEPEEVGRKAPCWFWLSRQYDERHRGQRAPIMVVLPDGMWFCVDSHYQNSSRPNPVRDGWEVSGRLEDGSLTVSPSINIIGYYHGWIQKGSISDDCEGRKFPAKAS